MRAGHPQLRRIQRHFWSEIDALSPGIDRTEFRRFVLGLVFLRYLDESFADRRAWLERESRDARSVYFCLDVEREQLLSRPDAYHAADIAFVLPAARWERLHAAASHDSTHLGRAVDATIISVVAQNPRLEGIFPEDYSRPQLSRAALASAIRSISALALPANAPPAHPDRPGDDLRTTADVLRLICQGFVAEATAAATRGPNRLRSRPALQPPEYATAIHRLDQQLRELARLLGRRPGKEGSQDGED